MCRRATPAMVGKLQSLKPCCAARRAVSFSSTSTSLIVAPLAICRGDTIAESP